MNIDTPKDILDLKGQRVNEVKRDEQPLVIHCHRDKRRRAVDPVTGKKGTINRYVRRSVRDVPLFGYPCIIDIQLAQVFISKNERRMESCKFVDKGYRFTHRLPYDQWPVSPHEHSGRC
ncbi:MAG: hypothetical protein L3J94_05935 [Gammaproteobacteria bacterium]|nr:hypothetical protein [Gammaproteobacteria bacterium]